MTTARVNMDPWTGARTCLVDGHLIVTVTAMHGTTLSQFYTKTLLSQYNLLLGDGQHLKHNAIWSMTQCTNKYTCQERIMRNLLLSLIMCS